MIRSASLWRIGRTTCDNKNILSHWNLERTSAFLNYSITILAEVISSLYSIFPYIDISSFNKCMGLFSGGILQLFMVQIHLDFGDLVILIVQSLWAHTKKKKQSKKKKTQQKTLQQLLHNNMPFFFQEAYSWRTKPRLYSTDAC